jgi:hypothetical protein
VFGGGSGGKHDSSTVVNDQDVSVAVAQAVARSVFPGSAASRTAEVCRRLEGASSWLQLASSSSSSATDAAAAAAIGAASDKLAAAADDGGDGGDDLDGDGGGGGGWGGTSELSRMLLDLTTPGCGHEPPAFSHLKTHSIVCPDRLGTNKTKGKLPSTTSVLFSRGAGLVALPFSLQRRRQLQSRRQRCAYPPPSPPPAP